MKVNRTTCAHEFETTDACGLCIVCNLCGKPELPQGIQQQVDWAIRDA